ncbi:MAG: hypothetical protein AB8G11_12690 [Saprospiraceae bacterium]
MKTNYIKFGHPIFILSIILLLLNDWFFKEMFHNTLTGKSSDFAGLLAFPYFFSVLFPKYRKFIHGLTILGFIFWKSVYAQPIINVVNFVGFPIHRVIDFTDNVALISVLASYFLLEHRWYLQLKPVVMRMIIGVSIFSFLATSPIMMLIADADFENQVYEFDFNRDELISRSNFVQTEAIEKLKKNINHYQYYKVDYDSDKDIFYAKNLSYGYYELPDKDPIDTLAIMIDAQKVANQDTILMETIFADWQMFATSDSTSAIKLLTLRFYYQSNKNNEKKEKKSLKIFEKHFIEEIRKYQK